MKTKTRLSSGELDLMDLLWREGPLTLAQAHASYGANSLGYTTMQTRLNRLVEKGLASKSGRPAEYRAAVEREAIQAGHLDQLISKLAGGSVVPLVAQLMQNRQISGDELAALKQLINDAEERPNDDTEKLTAKLNKSTSRGGKQR
jgi:BlaI family transcriptional regulator, penicillinase repressor